MNPSSMIDVATQIGKHLAREAMWDGKRCNWLAPIIHETNGRRVTGFATLGSCVYDGTAGIAMFLGQLFRATGDPIAGATAEGAIEHSLSRIDDIPTSVQLGFYTGFFGIGYAAADVGFCLGRADLVARGMSLIQRSLELDFKHRRFLDVMFGYAGVIPALLRLHATLGDAKFLDAAIVGGEALLHRAIYTERGASWDTSDEMALLGNSNNWADNSWQKTLVVSDRPHLTGLSHGAGGIARALLELGTITGDARFLESANHGFAYEDSWFDLSRDDWPDLRMDASSSSNQSIAAWCHGAPGIGMARLRAWSLTENDSFERSLTTSLRITARSILSSLSNSPNFSLCHGVAGNVELFLECKLHDFRDESDSLVEAVAQYGIERYALPRQPWPSGHDGAYQSPNLMLGLAGTGYFYLRLADPIGTPSILLVTPPRNCDHFSRAETKSVNFKRGAALADR